MKNWIPKSFWTLTWDFKHQFYLFLAGRLTQNRPFFFENIYCVIYIYEE